MVFDYEKTWQEFKFNIPERFNMAKNLIEDNIKKGKKDKIALQWENYEGKTRKITYREFAELSNKFGNALKNLGLKKEDRILFRTPNIPEFLIAFLGAVKIGAVPIPSSTLFRESEVEYRINDSGAVAVLSTPEHVGEVERVRERCKTLEHVIIVGEPGTNQISFHKIMEKAPSELEVVNTHPEDMAFMMYTSGTTGLPKGAVHVQRYAIGNDPASIYWQGYQANDLVTHVGELNWIFTLVNNFLSPFRFGTSTFHYQGKGAFDPEKWFFLIQKYRITSFAATPTAYRMLLTVKDAEKKYDLSSIRHSICAGEPLPAATFEEWKRRFGIILYEGIGMTEIMVYCSNLIGMKIRPDSCGKPQPGHVCGVIDSNGKSVPLGEEGQIAVSKDDPGLFKEYWNKPDKTAQVMQGEWFVSGDEVIKDEEGYIWFRGRADDLIKASGYRISPFEVESTLASHPAVLEAAAVQSPDEMRGGIVKGFVVLKKGYQPSKELIKDMQRHTKEVAAPYKYPREIEFVAELPKTQSGKIKRRELRELEIKRKGEMGSG